MNFSAKGTAKIQHNLRSEKRKLISKTMVTALRIFLIIVITVTILGTVAGVGVLKGLIDNAPSIDSIDVAPSGFSTTLYYSNGEEIKKLVGSDANRIYVTLDKIPECVQNAFIAIEDERFRSHNGIDTQGIFRAFFQGITKGEFDQGASTLTQQLIKNQVFEGGNEVAFGSKLKRKVQEQYLAVQLEKKLTKDQILEYYLNTINLGQNTLGIQVASKRYFNKDVSEITISEAAVIAGITQNPAGLNPITHPEENAAKRLVILAYMRDQGYITDEEYTEAVNDDVYSRIQIVNDENYTDTEVAANSYFVDELIDQVTKDLQEKLGYTESQAVSMVYRGGLQIETTQSKKLQKVCDKVFADKSLYPEDSEYQLSYRLSTIDKDGIEHNYSEVTMKYYFANHGIEDFDVNFKNKKDAKPYIEQYKKAVVGKDDEITGEVIDYIIQPQISFVLMDQKSGKVLAMVGGRGKKKASRTLNRASDTTRQPGSTFKIVSTYLPAFDTKGMTLATVEQDEEFYYPDTNRKVKNWSGEAYNGATTLRKAIYDSMNVIAVKTMVEVTPQVSYNYLMNLGFSTVYDKFVDNAGNVYTDIQYPTALGGLTKGVSNYELTAAFAAIANQGVYNKPVMYTKILDHDGNVLIDNEPEKKQVMKKSTAFLLTSAMEDVVTIGTGTKARFTEIDMAEAGKTGTTSNNVDLWFVGYTPYYTAGIWSGYDNNKSQTDTSYHKILWKKVMEEIHKAANKKPKDFKVPSSVKQVRICTKTGKLAVSGLCDHTSYAEYFDKNTILKEKCDRHVKLKVCKETGEIAGKYCLETEERVFFRNTDGTYTDEKGKTITKDKCKKHKTKPTPSPTKTPRKTTSPTKHPTNPGAPATPTPTPTPAPAIPTPDPDPQNNTQP
ncbi:MAG: transglycosylase domain-containing protein [Lachnospiraceae bacterium]|nr:transglycosylase domain-containing protein [Lachnospiraceae bacterium]